MSLMPLVMVWWIVAGTLYALPFVINTAHSGRHGPAAVFVILLGAIIIWPVLSGLHTEDTNL